MMLTSFLQLFCLQGIIFTASALIVDIDTSKPIFKVSERFVSITLDQNRLNLKPPFGCLDFSLPRVKNLLKGLSPAWLRFGGTTTDSVVFSDVSRDVFNAADVTPPLQTITAKDFDNLARACYDNGLRFLYEFDLQTRYGKQWDPTNALTLLTYISKQPYADNMDFELGNEPNDYGGHHGWLSFNGSEIGRDYRILKRILRKLNFKSASLVGPDTSPCALFGQFVKDAAENLTAATIHHYYFAGPNADVSEFINPKHFASYENTVRDAQKYIAASSRPDLPLWNGETSDAYNNGTKDVTDRYVSGFLWLDKLGVSAKMQVGVVMRQTFHGGNYPLVNDSMLPNPDYWLSYIHKQLVGQLVLDTRLKNDHSFEYDGPSTVRVYAHCARTVKGGVVFYGLSVDADPVTLKFDSSLGTEVEVYWLTPGDGGLVSQTVLLNGQALSLQDDKIPTLKPRQLDISGGFKVPPRTFGFIVFPNAKVSACA